MLSKTQFSQLADTLNEDGGFSVHTETGQPARSAVMAGGHSGVPEGDAGNPATGERIEAYARKYSSVLRRPENYLGGWGSSLDVSTAFPNDEKGTAFAVISGIARGEDAVGVVDAKGEYERELPTNAGMANPKTTRYQVPRNLERHGPREMPY